MRLKDKVAIVTGGGGGLGEGICTALAREGANIVVSDLNPESANRVVEKIIKMGQKSIAVETDVRQFDQCKDLVAKTLDEMGGIDIMVCNAGVEWQPPDDAPEPHLIENIPEEGWDLIMDVNLKGVFFSCKAVVPYFKKAQKGRIINISSVAGRLGVDALLPYAASKAGVISFSQSLAYQMAPYHVNVNTVCPGIIWTPMWKRLTFHLAKVSPDFKDASSEDIFNAVVQQSIPFGKPQTAEDIGDAVLFFASDEAKEITGQALNVCGGMRMN